MKRILIVDDDATLRRLLGQTLTEQGYEIQSADNGAVALRLLREQPVDLLITDIIMPDVEGLETIVTCRKEHPALKILAISGGGRLSAADYLPVARGLGATETLAKPFSVEQLLEIVQRLLGQTGAAGTDPP
jgi:DNA-binding NtrC family response regulator